MNNNKQWILEKSRDLFMKYGLKSVTMDDLAQRMGISKKTIYQHIDNKADLVHQTIMMFTCEEEAAIAKIRDVADDAIHEMLLIAKHATQMMRGINPSAIYDLKKYYRKSWDTMEKMTQQHIFNVIKNNLEQGVKQGVYRTDFNEDIVARFYVAKTLMVVDEDLFPLKQYNKEELFKEFINYHIHGIASPKGLALLEKHLVKN